MRDVCEFSKIFDFLTDYGLARGRYLLKLAPILLYIFVCCVQYDYSGFGEAWATLVMTQGRPLPSDEALGTCAS